MQPPDLDAGLAVVQQIVLTGEASGLPLQSLPSFKGILDQAWLQHLLTHPFLESQLQATRFAMRFVRLRRLQTYRANLLQHPADDEADSLSLFACSDLSSDDAPRTVRSGRFGIFFV